MARKITTEIFISEMKLLHKDKYDYSKVDYKSAKDKVCIICPEHGEFWQLPSNHRTGYGCPKCGINRTKAYNTEMFIKDSISKFGDKFVYTKTEYKNSKTLITIECPIHGEFEMYASNHLKSKTGCPKCNRSLPRKEIIVEGTKRKDLKEYRIWGGMKTRCLNPNTDDSSRYIDRGITCCDRWIKSFEDFYKDMGPCPENYSLDRIDNNKGYYPENCRWANSKTQAENKGDFNKIFTYNGESHVLKEWSRIFNINYTTLYNRIFRSGLSFEKAIEEDPYEHLIEINGEKKKLIDWCKHYNIKYNTVLNRIHKHKWTIKEALLTPYKHKKIEIQDIV